MKNHISLSLLTAVMLFGCSVPHNLSGVKQRQAPTLWENTSVGMTVEDVKRVQPAVFLSKRTDSVYDGAADELLQLKGVLLGNQKFDAGFLFASNKLVRINLGVNRIPEWEAARAIFLALQAELRVQYGKEDKSSTIERNFPIRMATVEWVRGGTKISLALWDSAIINVTYECAAWGEEQRRAMGRGHRRIDPKPRIDEYISC